MRAAAYPGMSGKFPPKALAAIMALAVALFSLAAQAQDFPSELESHDSGSESAVQEPPPRELVKVECLADLHEDYQGMAMSYPTRLFMDGVNREIYVTDSGNGRILVYTYDFFPLLTMGQSDGLESPLGVAVDPDGWVYVAQGPGRHNPRPRISVYNPALIWKRDIYFSGFDGAESFVPTNIAVSPDGDFYVAGRDFCGVVVLDGRGGFRRLVCPKDALSANDDSAPASICDVEVDAQGRIYLLSEEMGRVYVYDHRERPLFRLGLKGGSTGKLSRPRGLAVDRSSGRIYVIDYMRHTANVYASDGEFLLEFGGKGWREGWFQYPSDIDVDVFGNVLVADTFNNRVQVLHVQ